jgi:dienelactone hydrolase
MAWTDKRRGAATLPVVLVLLATQTFLPQTVVGQTEPKPLEQVLLQEIIPAPAAGFELRRYLVNHVPAPPSLPASSKDWDREQSRLRQHLLKDVVFHGWPPEWVNAPPHFEEAGSIPSGPGYRIKKLRYEIIPGFQSTAILYEPEKLQGKMPAILNVNGHVGPLGKSVEYKQKRCINFARHGIIALNLEWLSYGELNRSGNEHWFGGHLDLVGTHELGLFYLAMRKGLDYLYARPDVDRNRLGVTGLSGGGWQTIILSSLDERVKVAVPVAGFSSMQTRLEVREFGDLGDVEQSATDFLRSEDYTHLIAMMAPRPTLLTYNAEDDCCFRAPAVKPLIFDGTRPFFRLYGEEKNLEWHENRDPSDHNYQLDNRQAAYRFFSRHFGLPAFNEDEEIAGEIKSYDELVVGLPADNLTILDLARKLGRSLPRSTVPPEGPARQQWAESERERLRQVVRFHPLRLASAWTVAITKSRGLETKSYLFNMDNGLTADGVWLKPINAPQNAAATLILDDKGKSAANTKVSDRVNRGEQVLALDLLFTGHARTIPEPYEYVQILHGLGERPLGIEAGQLIQTALWMKRLTREPKLRLEVKGIRNQTVALVAAALEPALFSEIIVHEGMSSLGFLLEAPVPYTEAPDLFCLDLYKYFDLDRLADMAGTTKIVLEHRVEPPKKS